jgi:hypothetical protein
MVLWTDEWQAFLVGAQLVVFVLAAIVAGWQVLEARKLRLQQNRPFVVIDFEVESGYLIYLEVANLGTSLARDVQIEITPPLKTTTKIRFEDMKMLNEGIPTLVPGKKIRTLYDLFNRRKDESLPSTHRAVLTYTDEDGGREYRDEYVLDLELYRYLSTVTRKTIHDVHKQLEALNQTVAKWSANLGRGMIAMSREEAREEENRIVAEPEEIADNPPDDE